MVGALVLRAVGVVSPAPEDERVFGGQLVEPTDLAGVEVEGDDGITRLGGRLRVGVAGGDVDETATGVDRGRPPDRGARRPRKCRAIRASASRHRLRGNGVSLPDLIAGRRVEHHDTATERAAAVARIGGQHFLDRRHRHVETALMQRRRSGDTGPGVALDVPAPELGAGLRIDRIDARAGVTEVQRMAVPQGTDRDRGSHAGAGGIGPVTAPGLRVQGIDVAVLASDEEPSAGDGRLRPRGGRLGESERPLQGEVRHLVEVESSALRRLKAEVLAAHAPSTPVGAIERVHQGRCALAQAGTGADRIIRDGTAGDELRNRAALDVGQILALEGHDPICERCHDGPGGAVAQRLERGGAWHSRRRVARGALHLEQGRTSRFLRGNSGGATKHKHQDEGDESCLHVPSVGRKAYRRGIGRTKAHSWIGTT